MVEALKREVYEEIVGGEPAGNTDGTFAGKQGCKYSGFRKRKSFRVSKSENLSRQRFEPTMFSVPMKPTLSSH